MAVDDEDHGACKLPVFLVAEKPTKMEQKESAVFYCRSFIYSLGRQ